MPSFLLTVSKHPGRFIPMKKVLTCTSHGRRNFLILHRIIGSGYGQPFSFPSQGDFYRSKKRRKPPTYAKCVLTHCNHLLYSSMTRLFILSNTLHESGDLQLIVVRSDELRHDGEILVMCRDVFAGVWVGRRLDGVVYPHGRRQGMLVSWDSCVL